MNKATAYCGECTLYEPFSPFWPSLPLITLGMIWGYVTNFDGNLYLGSFCTIIPEPAIVTVLYTTIQYAAAAAALWTAVHSAHSVTGARPRARAPSL